MKLYLQYEVISQSHLYHFGECVTDHITSTQKTVSDCSLSVSDMTGFLVS